METIRAIVVRAKDNADKGTTFVHAEYETPDGLVVAKVGGRLLGLRPGDCFSADGTWKSSTFKGREEEIFRADNMRPDLPRTSKGVERFLLAALTELEHGVTPEAVRKLLADHGPTALRAAVEKPEILVRLSTAPERFRSAILQAWASRTQGGQAVSLMQACGLQEGIIEQIIAGVPQAPHETLRTRPYSVAELPHVGFENADRIGLHVGFSPEHRDRLASAVGEVLRREAAEGSTACDLDTLMGGLSSVSGIGKPTLLSFLRDAARDPKSGIFIFDHSSGPVAALAKLYVAEVQIQDGVKRLLGSGRRNDAEEVRRRSEALFAQPEFSKFDAVQRIAVEMAMTEPLSVVTGGPGVGKSAVMSAVTKICDEMEKGQLFLVAPTGMASKNLEGATKRKAQTVQRLLRASEERGGNTVYGHNARSPLPAGCVIVMDETSMTDAQTMAALMNAMPPDGRLVIVGDHDQLPSVGAGAVLGDILGATVGGMPLVPSVRLLKVYRQAEDSGIATGAALVREGTLPELGRESRAGVSFRDLPASRVTDEVIRLVTRELPGRGLDPIKDVAVLCPMAKGPGGTWEINERLSALLNPKGQPLDGVVRGRFDSKRMPIPRVGDRVMLTENDADNDVVNGDRGTIVGGGRTPQGRPTIVVRFDCGKEVTFPASRWRELILAYAGTIHKSQGSQFKAVIMPFLSSQARMHERRLVYTGWTRAQSELIMVGERSALDTAVATTRSEMRFTLLGRFLSGLSREAVRRPDSIDWHARWRLAQAETARAQGPAPITSPFGRPRRKASSPGASPLAAAPTSAAPQGIPGVRGLLGPRRRPAAQPDAASNEAPPAAIAPPMRSLFGARKAGSVRTAPSPPPPPLPSTPGAEPQPREGVGGRRLGTLFGPRRASVREAEPAAPGRPGP
jgi:exodeoxyribonuclease V alpha subunit